MSAQAAGPIAHAQMNIRIERTLKERGDAALQAMGFSPTEAVRALWRLACGTARDLDDLARLLKRGKPAEGSACDANGAADEPLQAGWTLYRDACAKVGIAPTAHRAFGDAELLEQELAERLAERGLA